MSKSFQELIHDIMLLIVEHLSPVDKVCLALASKGFHETALSATNSQCFNDIIAYKPPATEKDSQSNAPSDFVLRLLLGRLRDWAPADHVLCSKNQDEFVRGGEEGVICHRCRRLEWLGKIKTIKELKAKKEKGSQLQWYETL